MAATRKVYLFTTDISKFVMDVDNIVQSAGEYGQLTVNEIPGMTGRNTTGFWDVNNPSSPFYGNTQQQLNNQKITIVLDGVTVFYGGIRNLQSDNLARTCAIELQSALQFTLERGSTYASEAKETPSQAIANICLLYNVPFDSASFAAATATYLDNNIYIEVRDDDPWNTVMDVFQLLIDAGVGRLYSLNGILYYDVYSVRTIASSYTFSDRHSGRVTIYSHPTSDYVTKDLVNGYSVETMEGIAPFGAPEEQSKQISGGVDSLVRILDLQSGVWIGDLWLSYLNRPQKRIEFGIPSSIGKSLVLNTAVTLDYTLQNWLPTVIDINTIDNTTRVISKIAGLTR